jgi:hypothetical protein
MSLLKKKQTKAEALLVTMAESIGSTLGTIAAKAKEVPDALSHSTVVKTAEREGKKVVRKSKTLAGKIKKTAAKNAKSSKLAKAGRRGLRRATAAAKRVKSKVA